MDACPDCGGRSGFSRNPLCPSCGVGRTNPKVAVDFTRFRTPHLPACVCGYRGPYPQSRQHLAMHALHALGRGIAITKDAEAAMNEFLGTVA